MIPSRMGRYKVIREIGRGAMGVVMEVDDPESHQRLALKIMQVPEGANPDGLGMRSLRARFHREIEALTWLQHPHIVAFFDQGTYRQEPYYLMERLEGPTLRQDQQHQGALPPAECVRAGTRCLFAGPPHWHFHRLCD